MNFISNVYNFVFFRKSCYSNLKVPEESCPGMTQERELRVPRSSLEDLAGPPRALADYVLS